MSAIAQLLGLERRSVDDAVNLPLNKWMSWLDGGMGPASTGIYVDEDAMMRISAAYGAVRIIAETIGVMQLDLIQTAKDGSEGLADNDPTFWALRRPNAEQHQMDFFMTLVGHGAARGNSYCQVLRDGKGRAVEFWPLHPERITVHRKNGLLAYHIAAWEPGQNADYTVWDNDMRDRWIFRQSGEMMHFKLLSSNGVTGMSPLEYARNTFGLALAHEEYASRLFSNGAMPRGILTSKEEVSDEDFDAFKDEWKRLHTGIWNAHKTAILPAGVEWQQISLSAEDAQFLLSRKFQLAEIARIFRVPLHLLQELDRSTFNNITQQSLEFLIYTIQPWLTNWEQTIYWQVLTQTQRDKGLSVRFNRELLLGLDPEKQAQRHRTYVQIGVMSPNEARKEIGRNPVPGGDEFFMQGAMSTVENLSQEPADDQVDGQQDQQDPQDQQDGAQQDEENMPVDAKKPAKKQSKKQAKRAENRSEIVHLRAQNGFRKLIQEQVEHIQRKEAQTLAFKAKKLRGAEYSDWLARFCGELQQDLQVRLISALSISASGLVESAADIEKYVQIRAKRISDTYSEGVKAAVAELIERSGSWPSFMLSLESPELEQERGKLARQIAASEITAILALEDEDYAAA